MFNLSLKKDVYDHFWDITHSIIHKIQAIMSILVYYPPNIIQLEVIYILFFYNFKKINQFIIFFPHDRNSLYFSEFLFLQGVNVWGSFQSTLVLYVCSENSWPTIYVCTINQRRLWIYQSVFLGGYTIMNLTGQTLTITRGRQWYFYNLHPPSFTSMFSKKEYLTIFTDSHQ